MKNPRSVDYTVTHWQIIHVFNVYMYLKILVKNMVLLFIFFFVPFCVKIPLIKYSIDSFTSPSHIAGGPINILVKIGNTLRRTTSTKKNLARLSFM